MRILLVISAILFVFTATASESKQHYEKLYQQGNKSYEQNKFEEAIASYTEITGAGYQSGGLYFNLGNAYYKSGKLPEAILFYERAKKLKPDDDDIKFNLEMAYQQTTDKIEPIPQLFYQRWLNRLVQNSSTDNWATMVIVFMFIGFSLLCLFVVSQNVGLKKLIFSACVFMFAFTAIAYLCASHQYSQNETTNEAIVFSPTVNVLSSPKEEGTTLFVIHEGTKIKVLKENGDWKKIALANGNVGWLKTSQIEGI